MTVVQLQVQIEIAIVILIVILIDSDTESQSDRVIVRFRLVNEFSSFLLVTSTTYGLSYTYTTST